MKRIVVDAALGSTWFLRRRKSRNEISSARNLLIRARRGRLRLVQPMTWYADVAAILLRVQPKQAAKMTDELTSINARIDDTFAVLKRAVSMAATLDSKLTDTLYHATAIEHGIPFVTSSASYYRKAHHLGHIMLLAEWPMEPDVEEPVRTYDARQKGRPGYLHKKR